MTRGKPQPAVPPRASELLALAINAGNLRRGIEDAAGRRRGDAAKSLNRAGILVLNPTM